jgi:hypothetical protein
MRASAGVHRRRADVGLVTLGLVTAIVRIGRILVLMSGDL